MSSLLLLIVCLALGAIVARLARPGPAMAQSLNWWVINVALSAMVLHLMPQLKLEPELWFLFVSMWAVFLGAWGVFSLLGRLLGWSRERIGALTLIGGLGNTSFVGFPLIEALRGVEGLKLAMVADQAGGFIALAVGGSFVAALYSGGHVSAGAIVRRIVLFPPTICMGVGLAVGAAGGWPEADRSGAHAPGATLVPLALFSVGLQFRLDFRGGQLGAMSMALGWKLLAGTARHLGHRDRRWASMRRCWPSRCWNRPWRR